MVHLIRSVDDLARILHEDAGVMFDRDSTGDSREWEGVGTAFGPHLFLRSTGLSGSTIWPEGVTAKLFMSPVDDRENWYEWSTEPEPRWRHVRSEETISERTKRVKFWDRTIMAMDVLDMLDDTIGDE